MKICITSQGDNLESQVDPRFGRSQYFIIIDTDSMDFEAILNPNVSGMGGVGVQAGTLMSEKDVKFVLTGNVGPNAFSTLQAANVEIITGVSGLIKDVIEKYKKGEYSVAKAATVDSKGGLNA